MKERKRDNISEEEEGEAGERDWVTERRKKGGE